jgi:hypothetical protein
MATQGTEGISTQLDGRPFQGKSLEKLGDIMQVNRKRTASKLI